MEDVQHNIGVGHVGDKDATDADTEQAVALQRCSCLPVDMSCALHVTQYIE
jgi:hypothetical protein